MSQVMFIEISKKEIELTLQAHLDWLLPHHKIRDVYHYAVFPAGKLFRPSLVWSILFDLDQDLYQKSILNKYSPHALLASAVELHHSYTLIHDDLPCMDNDSERRGKPSTHKAFGEWQALLAGDGLLNLSYQLISKSNHPRTIELIRFFSWALGPKGLIHGQVLDLSLEMGQSFTNTIRTHELKTARLIQASVLGSAVLATKKETADKALSEKKLWKFSKLLGINFQLIDDLTELAEEVISEHEISVNPWLSNPEMTHASTLKSLEVFQKLSQELKLESTHKIVSQYYQTMLLIITSKQEIIENHLQKKIDLSPMILLMKNFC